jgi:hypothetical protein
MRQPYSCPICGRLTVRQVFERVRITADFDQELRNVGGLVAFICAEYGHVFFVSKKDIELERPSGVAAGA